MPEAPGVDALRKPHFPAKAKRVIFLFMHGGPSSIDTWDPKPRLIQDHDKPLPFKRPLTFAEGRVGNLMKSPWEFKNHGKSGIPVSTLFPNVASCVDDLCVVRSMVGDSVAHGGALLQLHTGSNTSRGPAWDRGLFMAWVARTRTCLVLSTSSCRWRTVVPRTGFRSFQPLIKAQPSGMPE
jgi:hypothetical protein